jgi:hypothetical protein
MSEVSPSEYIKNFPLPTLREKQSYVLNEIDSAFASGYKYIILQAHLRYLIKTNLQRPSNNLMVQRLIILVPVLRGILELTYGTMGATSEM